MPCMVADGNMARSLAETEDSEIGGTSLEPSGGEWDIVLPAHAIHQLLPPTLQAIQPTCCLLRLCVKPWQGVML